MVRRWLKKQLVRLQEVRKQRKLDAQNLLKARYHVFRSLLASNNRAVDCLTEISILLRMQGDPAGLARLTKKLIAETGEMVGRLENLAGGQYRGLWGVQENLADTITAKLKLLAPPEKVPFLLPLAKVMPAHTSMTGNKAAALATLRRKGSFRVPDGFVVTLAGCSSFLDHEGLSLKLVHILATHGSSQQQTIPPAVARQVQELIREATLPPGLIEELAAAVRPFLQKGKALAVRSSSISEDGRHHSFAGQFSSVLNVKDEAHFFAAFKEVVASNFNARSLAYRLNAGLDPLHFDMAVLCLEMVEARAAGILLSQSPQEPESDLLLISAVPGLGEAAVSGSAAADLYHVHPDGSVDWQRSTIADKERFLVCSEDGGLVWQDLRPEERLKPVLDTEELQILAAWGKALEAAEGMPQDLEWAVDKEGQPIILQMRPLTTMGAQTDDSWMAKSPPLAEGIMASGGRATGQALLVKNKRDLEKIPQTPVVLVMPQSFVDAANLLGMVAAVLVDLGSPADHLACVAREQETPMICGLGQAGTILTEGEWLTVDGHHGRVYAASSDEIRSAEEAWKNGPPTVKAAQINLPPLYRDLQELVTALHLTDAYGPTFSIMECRSLHDIIRFVHEKGVLAMFNAGDELLEGNLGVVHAIDSPVPFFISVIDMGGGLSPVKETLRRRIPPEMVLSRPFQALWKGITTPGLHWGPPPGGAPMGAVMSSFITDQKSERPIGMPNYCMVSRDYCNMNARMDFHFIMIDAVCSLSPRSNHIKFRFKGGGTSLERRRRRALCIGEIFEHYGFAVDVREDLVNAALQGATAEAIEEKLVMVGRILGFTRLLDAFMADDTMITKVAAAFMVGNYTLDGIDSL
ncbi:MAG: pyruvate, phosphate dikinase [Proteobacteria bacterium]|nr:pyruvate, phosphate dikinase [Pseudomonadota bacterium]MBU1649259.1 pyruvate, phosphate dikinase [Pseudomonadota bacterium]